MFIDNANHFYIGQENEIGNIIIDWIKRGSNKS